MRGELKDKYIVAIGASAGGLEAIHEFFDHMPQSASFSFIVIQHLSSDYKSLLVELVAKHTHMKVFEAAHDMVIQQDCVYIIPNNKLMTVSKGKLKLADKSLTKAPNTAIDTFLHTLAEDKKEKAIAIILSGTGTDGTKGIHSIKECGGMVIVQDPATAKFDGMPNSAIASGNADYILAAENMHQELFNYVNEEPVKVLENGKLDEQLLDEIFGMVHEQSGNDFNLYKTPTIIRRIGRRMNENGLKNLKDYVRFLSDHREEVKVLGQDFLIGVTKFFRDQQAYEVLADKILPDIIRAKADNDILKIWVCACSTGQEAYSIAILVNECMERLGKKLDVKIFATDIDEKSIEIASRNQYPESIAKEIPAALFSKYFIKEGKYYGVMPEVRKQVVFAKHDVIKSPPFIKNDMVTCRNMLIYVNSVLQEKILSTFHFSLNQGGYLFLGSSETASALRDGIREISSKWKFYQKSGSINYSSYHTYNTGSRLLAQQEKNKNGAAETSLSSIEKTFSQFVTEDLGFVGVFIDKSYIIQEAVGNYRRFLSLPDQKIQLNILKMVPREVSIMLNTALRKSWKENKKTHLKRIRFNREEEDIFLNISIQPPEGRNSSGYTMIVFSESTVEALPDKEDLVMSMLANDHQNEYVFELEAELNETRSNLQMAVEEMETTNEELQSSNEELLSANEELQSSNEELQSLNEELHTLNTEHQVKIRELVELNDDLDNYFRSTDIGQVFLDASLYIRKFNPAAISMVNLIDADIGRSIEHISNNIKAENLTGDIRSVLLTGHLVEKEVQLKNGNRSLMRIMPYVRRDKKTDGVVITFVDISHITELNNIITGVFNASLNAVLAFTAVRNQDHFITDFKCVSFNDVALDFLHKTREQLSNTMLVKQLPELTEGNLFAKYVNVVEKGTSLQTEFQNSSKRWYQLVAVKMSDGFAATLTDITERKAADQRLKKNYNELIVARETLKTLNSELEEKVRARTQQLSASEDRFNEVARATNDTIWDWSLVDNTMWRSDNMDSMFGYSRSEETSNIGFWFDKIHPDDRKRVKDSVFAAINQNEKQWSEEYRFLKSNGEYAAILDRGTILHDDYQTPYRMVGSMIDITRLIDTEQKLSSSERKFRKVFDSNVIGMLFSDLYSGKILTANEAFVNMIGYTREEIENQQVSWQQITPEEYMEVGQAAVRQIEEHGVCPPFEKKYIHRDGRSISVLIGSALLDAEDSNEVVTYIINITEQKENEQRRMELQKLIKKQQDEFYGIFKNAPAMITIRRTENLVYEFVNNAFREFFGDHEYIGKSSHEVKIGLSGESINEVEEEVFKTGVPHIGKSFLLERIDPESGEHQDCWFDFIYTPVYNDQGVVDGIAFFGFDVTELVKGQKATKELMMKKDEFMSIASHELKTPITSMKGFLQIALKVAERNKSDLQVLGLINKANRQIGNLTLLVDDLLDVTKIQAGKMQFNFSTFNVKTLIEECVDDLQNTEKHEVVIEQYVDVDAYADRHRIEQVVRNFLSNAIKYSPEAGKVLISSEIEGDMLRVAVRDFGIGIPSDKAKYVFDRFFRVQESSVMFSGLGLGLYISSEIVERHGGTIGVNSEENKGSEFWFNIPLKQPDEQVHVAQTNG
ncbi:chemotaxis response regulator (methyltransferase) [Pedobacter sp. BAL39]|uniref:chemotaxis protein CheB n=1 Tax=Pedobacter sp. BAL39 TaxID=391596 RepID=UPI0001559743|nr:chemotaxis protein CheB [Pedobacter sp. BAL39]EDM36206.1 chemotaxis response regulator (methyltransferase) [Pedobacter sp. BAL39]